MRTATGGAGSVPFDAGVAEPRLERLTRLVVVKYWRNQDDAQAARDWVFLFRKAGRFIYLVLPVYRGRYHAVARFHRRDMTLEGPGLADLEVRSISILEANALRLAANDVQREP